MPIWLLIRLLTIPLGIMSALALARDGLGFELSPFLDAVVNSYGLILDDLFLDVALAAFGLVFDLLRDWFNWHWNLYPHWKHVFILTWLFWGSWYRALLWTKPDAFMQVGAVLLWLPSAAIATFTAALAGTASLSGWAIFFFSTGGFLVNWTLLAAEIATVGRDPEERWVTVFQDTFLTAYNLTCVAYIIAIVAALVSQSTAKGLLALVVFVMVFATVFLGALFLPVLPNESEGEIGARSMLLRVGLDIYAVLGGATIILYLAHLMA